MKPTFLAAAVAAGLTFAGAVGAQPDQPPPGGGRGAVRQACMPDFQKFCPDARPGPGGGMRECVMTHHADFSQPCQSALAQMRAARQQRREESSNATAPQ